MALFTQLIKALGVIYTTGATVHTLVELLLYTLNYQNSVNRVLAGRISAEQNLITQLHALLDIWLSVWAQQDPLVAFLTMLGHFFLGVFLLALIPNRTLEKIGL